MHTWQLSHLEREDWEQVGATAGMRSAVCAELTGARQQRNQTRVNRPPTVAPGIVAVGPDAGVPAFATPSAADTAERHGAGPQLTLFQRRFLLQPSANSGEPTHSDRVGSLRSLGAAFLGTMLVVPIEERQQLYVVAGELLGVLSGLLLPIPLGFISTPPNGPGDASDVGARVRYSDGGNTLAFVSFFSFLVSMLGALLMAMMAVFQGWQANHTFCEGLNRML
eukprot:3635756-Prymnesium_polylepis.1